MLPGIPYPQPAPQPESPAPSREDKVLSWRKETLERAGYDRDAAQRLAEAKHVDLHRAVDLLKSCEQELALRILL